MAVLDEIREALNEASPAPWRDGMGSGFNEFGVKTPGQVVLIEPNIGMWLARDSEEQQTWADANLIVLARNYLPALLSVVEAAAEKERHDDECRRFACIARDGCEERDALHASLRAALGELLKPENDESAPPEGEAQEK